MLSGATNRPAGIPSDPIPLPIEISLAGEAICTCVSPTSVESLLATRLINLSLEVVASSDRAEPNLLPRNSFITLSGRRESNSISVRVGA